MKKLLFLLLLPSLAFAQQVKISALPSASTLGSTDLFPVVQGIGSTPVTNAATPVQIAAFVLNGLSITSTTGTIAITNGKTLACQNSLTFAGTDASTLNIGTGGTLGTNAYTSTAYFPITGTTAGGNATAGNVGEEVQSLVASGSAVSLTTATAANVTSISLTAGDWDVEGIVTVAGTSATDTAQSAGINTTSATIPTDGSEGYSGVVTTTATFNNSITLSRKRINVTGTTTVYLAAKTTFSAGSAAAFGSITARRVR